MSIKLPILFLVLMFCSIALAVEDKDRKALEDTGCPLGCGGACNHYLPASRAARFYPAGETPSAGYLLSEPSGYEMNRSRTIFTVIENCLVSTGFFFRYISGIRQQILGRAISGLQAVVNYCVSSYVREDDLDTDLTEIIEITDEDDLETLIEQILYVKAHLHHLAELVKWVVDHADPPIHFRQEKLEKQDYQVMPVLRQWLQCNGFISHDLSSFEYVLGSFLPNLDKHTWLIVNQSGNIILAVTHTEVGHYRVKFYFGSQVYLIRDKETFKKLIMILNQQAYPVPLSSVAWHFIDLGE